MSRIAVNRIEKIGTPLGGLACLGLACAFFVGLLGKTSAQVIILDRDLLVPQSEILIARAPGGTAALPPAVGDVIRFLDGSELHGELGAIAPGLGVRWQNPGVQKEIQFRADNIGSIHFAKADRGTNAEAVLKPSCQVQLADGDIFFAKVLGLDDERVILDTAFAGEAKISRAAVQSISFLPRDFAVVYDGPIDGKEWQVAPAEGWSFRDGVYVGNSGGAGLSKAFDVAGSVTVEFDLAWEGTFGLMVRLESGQRQDSEGVNGYFISLTSSGVDVRRQNMISALGRVEVPGLGQKGKCRFTIQCNRTDGTLSIFADHQLLKRWKDANGVPNGLRNLFLTDMSGRRGLRLSNIRVMSWRDIEPAMVAGVQTNSDSVSLVNHDMAQGKITGIDGGNLKLLLGNRTLTVPLARVTRIDFASGTNSVTSQPKEVRAWLADGGRVSFQLKRWDNDRVAAHSDVFGDFALRPQSVRELEFNLGRPRKDPAAASSDLRGLDD